MSLTATTHRIVHLDGSGCDIREVGGKAAGLDRLAAHGFAIPSSYAVPASAYREAIASAGLEPWLTALARRPAPAPQDLAADIAEVERTFHRIELDRRLATAIEKVATALLGRGRVAVRSSATAEDLGFASFAGQYRTFTLLDDLEAVLDAVKACWASLWLPSAREYRRRHRVQPADLAMAVVIQSMVEADWSGVAFTSDPGTDLPVMRIEVVPGLGESLVSGRVTPLDFTVRRDTLEITGQDGATAPDFLEDLARMMLQIEDQLDEPQDVEWAAIETEITLLQARPITVVGPRALFDDGFDQPMSSEDEFTPYGIVEMLPGTIDPLLWTINCPMIEYGYRTAIADLGGDPGDPGRPLIGRFRGRPALNLSALRDLAVDMPGGSAQDVERQFLGRSLTEEAPPRGRAGIGATWRARRVRSRLAEEVELVRSAADAIVGLRLDLETLPALRLAGYHHAVRDLAWRIVAAEVAASSAATAAFRGLEIVLQRWLDPDESTTWAQRLTAGTLGHHAAGARLDYGLRQAWRRAVAADPSVMDAIGTRPEHMAHRMGEFGHVGARLTADVTAAARMAGSRAFYGGLTWEEDPELVWRRFSTLAAPDDAQEEDAPSTPLLDLATHLQGRRSWRTIRILTGQIVDLRFRWVARQAEEAAGTLALRERAKSALLTLGGEQRRIIQEATSRLVASRQLGRPKDVDFLSVRELDAMLLGAPPPPAAAMHSRRSIARRTASAPPLPEIFAGSPGVAAVEDIAAGRALAGWPASSGWVTATARVVGDIVDASRLRRGDILVASATDPSWTPIILDAGAVVLETGGPLSHAALVAREFGIPAVLRVNGATRIIEDGEPLEVDGYAGLVTRVDYEEAKPP